MENSFENVHSYLKSKRKDKSLSTNEKDTFYKIINTITERTENQKRRFILYYGLDKAKNYKQYTYREISEINKSSISAIRYSVIRVGSTLNKLEKELIKNINLKKR